jgi:hypothetical protein
MNPGTLQWTATVKRESSFDNLGRRDGDFSTSVGTFRCSVEDRGTSEIEFADGTAVSRTYEIRARWESIQAHSLTEIDRLLITPGNILVRISGITNSGLQDREAVIEATEITL